MTTLWRDLFYAIRRLRKDPQLVIVVTFVIGLGIGANTAIFSVVYGVLLRALPYEDPGRLVVLLRQSLREGGPGRPVAPANFYDWREQAGVFEEMTAAEVWGPALTGQDASEQLPGLRASGNLFEMLGFKPLMGRGFTSADEQPGSARVVVLSYGLWQRRFGGRADIAGQTLRLDGEIYTVAGVMPQGFGFPTFWAQRAELWTPLIFSPERAQQRSGSSLRIFARLKPGVTVTQAQAKMSAISARLAQQYPDTNSDDGAIVEVLSDKTVANVRPTIVVLAGAAGLLMLIACVNVANLLLARAAMRQREVAVRRALGAGRGDIVRQLLSEGVVLSAAAGLVGLLLANWGIDAMLATIPETAKFSLPRREAIAIDSTVMSFALALSLLTAVLFSLAPALKAMGTSFTPALRQRGRGTHGSGGTLRGVLVVGEVSLALMLLPGAGLLIRSFVNLQAIDPGFEPRNVITMVASVTGSRFGTPERKGPFYETLVENVAALPGVERAAAVNHVPLEGDRWSNSFYIEGRPTPAPAEASNATYRVATPGYFQTMGTTLLRGRDFAETDRHDAPRVLIINETMARLHFAGEDPIAKRVKVGGSEADEPWWTIVGVVQDVQQWQWAEVDSEVYLPFAQETQFYASPSAHYSMTLVVRTKADPAAMANALRQQVWALDPNIPVSNVVTMEQAVSHALWQPRFSMFLLGVFAAVALVLAAVGVYGVMSYTVTQRTSEIGVRLALGARRGDVLGLMVRQGSLLAITGIALGLGGAYALSRLMVRLVYQVSTTDAATFVAASAVLMTVALLACLVPALRASRIDPMTALRYE